MGSAAAFVLQSGILWVLAALVGTLVGSWLLVIYWEYSISRALGKYPQDFDHIQGEIKKILQEIQSYSPEDPLPYGPIVAGINRQVDTIANQLADFKKQYADIQTQHHKMSAHPVRYILGAPVYIFTWYGMYRNTKKIQPEIEGLQGLIGNAWSLEKDLAKQAWLLASRVRAAITQQKNVRQMMDYLSDQKLYGDTFDAMVEKEDLANEVIEHIPEYFLVDEEESISDHAGKLDVWVVHKLLSEAEPLLEDMHEKLSLWISQYEKLAEKVDHHRDQLAHLEQLVNAVPEGIDLQSQKTQIVALRDTLKVLSDTLTRLEVESIEPVERELDHVQMIITEDSVHVRQGYNDFSRLNKLLAELSDERAEASIVIEKLVRSPTYPINWDRSNTSFMEINKRVSEFSNPQGPRTVEEINKDANAAQELLESMRSLNSRIHRIERDHQDLLDVFTSDEIQHGMDRLREYYQLGDQIAQYDLENWITADSAPTYIDDVQNLEAAQQVFLGRDYTERIPETEIEQWLQQAIDLVGDHAQLKVRSEKLLARLQFIKSTESEAKEQFATVEKAFNQLKWLVNSNVLLEKIATNDIEKISPRVVQSGAQLSEPRSGKIEDKLRRVQSLRDALENAGRKWLELLNQDINQRRSLLTGKIELINNIARLDDPAIEKAQRLLEQLDLNNNSIRPTPDFHLDFEDIISELNSRSLKWQELVAIQTELEEIVETPLVDAYKHVETQRNLSLDALAAASRIIPERRQWPPCTVSISNERLEMDRLESVHSEIAGKNTRAIWAVRQYGELAASYQTLTGKIERSIEWANHEQNRITDLEKEIERLNRHLKQQEQSAVGDVERVQQYRRLRAQANLTIERQKQRWISSAPGSSVTGEYEDILQSLVETTRTLRETVDQLRADSQSVL